MGVQQWCLRGGELVPYVSMQFIDSASEIIRELRRLRYDPANGRGRGRKLPLKRIAEQTGVHRATLYRVIRSGRVSDKSRAALSLVLVDRV